MSKKLNLEDRYYISMYSRRLPCTLELRFAIDNFLDQIAITGEEASEYKVDVDKETNEFKCTDLDYVVEYPEFPQPVINAMNTYIGMYDHEKNADNVLLQRTIEYFKKIL